MAGIFDTTRQLLKNLKTGVSSFVNKPLKPLGTASTPGLVQQGVAKAQQYFDPTRNSGENFWNGMGGKTLVGAQQTLGKVGNVLQSIPKATTPQIQTKSKLFNSVFNNDPITKMTAGGINFLTDIPRDYGRAASQISTPQGVTDFRQYLGGVVKNPISMKTITDPSFSVLSNIVSPGFDAQDIGRIGSVAIGSVIAKKMAKRDAERILLSTRKIDKTLDLIAEFRQMRPAAQMDVIGEVQKQLDNILPDVGKSKEMLKMKSTNLEGWLNQAGRFLGSAQEQARNQVLPNLGMSVKEMKGTKGLNLLPDAQDGLYDVYHGGSVKDVSDVVIDRGKSKPFGFYVTKDEAFAGEFAKENAGATSKFSISPNAKMLDREGLPKQFLFDYEGGTIKSLQDLKKFGGSQGLQDRAARWAKQQGYDVLDWGGKQGNEVIVLDEKAFNVAPQPNRLVQGIESVGEASKRVDNFISNNVGKTLEYKGIKVKVLPLEEGKLGRVQLMEDAPKYGLKKGATEPLMLSDWETLVAQQPLSEVRRSELTGKQLSQPSSLGGENVSPIERAKLVVQRHKELSSELEKAIQKPKKLGQPSGVSIADLPKAQKEIIDSVGGTTPQNKVNLLDYMRTPDRVLNKIGLGKEAILLKKQYRSYLKELPVEINKITDWFKKAPSPESSQNIFRYLDGKQVELSQQELGVAKEIQGYLKDWAVKLKLPQDKQVSHYITHLFDEELIKKEFDPEIAKLITDQVPGSVYDPFLQKRLGALGYKEDVWEALDAYTKRAVRKYNMDPALEALKKASNKLDVESERYVARLGARINLRPTEVDNLLDNLAKSVVGYKLGARPVANVSRKIRQAVYRGTLGLNVGSAVRNLTQGANTYAKLGEKYTTKGYISMFKDLLRNGDELKSVGVLSDSIVQDRTLNATKKFWENTDKGLFSLFSLAERVNRGAAYFGAKAKALSQGLPEEEAIQKAIKMVEDTQFTFGSVDTPLALQSDLVKMATQFQSYNVKQAEFLTEMVKNKEFGGMLRFVGANLVFMATIGKLFGMELKDIIPFSGVLSGETKLGQTPPIQAVGALGNIAFGDEDKRQQGIYDLKKVLPAFVPAGVQAKKTIEGVKAFNEGASTTPSGRTRFEVPQTPTNRVKTAIFGQYSIPEAKEYFKNMGTPKSVIEYEKFKKLKESDPEAAKKLAAKIKKESPSLYAEMKRVKKDEELKITKEEKQLRGLGVQDKSRARSIVKLLNKYPKGSQERKDFVKRYQDLGIITPEVYKQLQALLSTK